MRDHSSYSGISGSVRRRENTPGAEDQAMGKSGPLILLPGMAADARLFEPQRRAFPDLVVPTWIEPEPEEPLQDYAGRMARSVEPIHPSFVGGASFGGMVALEMAACLGLPTCFLIASVRAPDELPWRLRALRPLARFGPERLGSAADRASRWLAPSVSPATAGQLRRLSAPQATFLRWACWAVLNWSPSPDARLVNVRQIHGSNDRTFPLRYTRPDEIVQGGGHLLTRTHPEAVNAFLSRAGAGGT